MNINILMKKKIVIVEDDASIVDSLRIILERAGYEVEYFYDGKNLLESDGLKTDLYLIDKQLSGIDGLDICKYLKSDPRTKHIPVIVLSASPGIENIVKAAGADAFIEKPFSSRNLVEVVRHYTTT